MYAEEYKRNIGFWRGKLKEAQGFEYVGQNAGLCWNGSEGNGVEWRGMDSSGSL